MCPSLHAVLVLAAVEQVVLRFCVGIAGPLGARGHVVSRQSAAKVVGAVGAGPMLNQAVVEGAASGPQSDRSLALEIDGRVEVGAVYDPSRRELFTAERGRGAFLNGGALAVSTTPDLLDALLVTGFPYDIHAEAGDLVEQFAAFLGRARGVRRLGSAALDLCYVAAGRFDGFWEERLKSWDVAAGSLIVEEAGGRITGMDGSSFDLAAAHLVASNGSVHGPMLEVIRDTRTRRSRRRTD